MDEIAATASPVPYREDGGFEERLAELLERIQLDGSTALAEFRAAYPDYAVVAERRVRELADLGLLDLDRPAPRPSTPPTLKRIGRYRILRRLGTGGMGVVYLAFDEALRREVALKTLHAHFHASDSARQRFHREARAIGQLRHPGIIPVFEVGEFEGAPFFVMEFVPGRTLAAILSGLKGCALRPADLSAHDLRRFARSSAGGGEDPKEDGGAGGGSERIWGRTYVETSCRLAARIADALASAHAAGIQHRDVKPSNILVTLRGDVRLLDFGLAQWRADGDLTLTGDLVGTPAYMSPEQAAGRSDAIDARTDVYALGVTLYELLTLSAPFQGRTTQAILHAVARAQPVPPRRLNPAIPRDVETVCLTAMDKEPARRYPSASELADDLRRFLEYRPVQARPVGPGVRFSRAIRRRPAVAAALGLAGFTVIAIPVGLAIANVHIRAEATRALAYGALLEKTLLDLDPEELGKDARATDLLRAATRRVRAQLKDYPAELAWLLTRIGSVLYGLGAADEAEPILSESLAILVRELGAEHRQVAETLNHLANVQSLLGRFDQSEDSYRQALATAARTTTADDRLVQMIRGNLAGLLVRKGSHEEAEGLLREGLRSLGRAQHADPKTRADLLVVLGHSLIGRGALAEAEAIVREGHELVGALPEGKGSERIRLLTLAGGLAKARSDGKAAEAHYSKALEFSQALFPEVSLQNAVLIQEVGTAKLLAQDYPGAEGRYREALRLFESVLGKEPDHVHLALARTCLARVLLEQGRHAEAEPHYRAALRGFERNPGVHQIDRTGSMLGLADTLVALKAPPAEAADLFAAAAERFRAAYGERSAALRSSLAGLWRARRLAGDLAGSVAACERLLGFDAHGAPSWDHANTLRSVGELLAENGRHAEAARRFDEALAAALALGGGQTDYYAVLRYLGARSLEAAGEGARAETLLREALISPRLAGEVARFTKCAGEEVELIRRCVAGEDPAELRRRWRESAASRPQSRGVERDRR